MNWFATWWSEPIPDDIKKLKAPHSKSFRARDFIQARHKAYDPHHKKFALKLYEIDHIPKNVKDKFRLLKAYPELKQW
jgi:hypothetical protein